MFATVGLNEWDGRRAGRWREHGRHEGAGGFARANRAVVRCCREDDTRLTGRTESYSKQRGVGLRHVNASDVVAGMLDSSVPAALASPGGSVAPVPADCSACRG